ncbi:RNA-directed DNA polymerase, LTR Retrotransposon, partial [Trachipleistophora hominis]
NFRIEYSKPVNLVEVDALSRTHEKAKEPTEINKRAMKRYETINKKHLCTVDGKKHWRLDSGIVREVPEKENAEKLVIEAHLKTNHRGLEPICYEPKERYYWLGMKRHITEIIKRCETCQRNNRKYTGRNEMVATTRPIEKVTIDIAKIKGKTVMISVDYFSRRIWVRDVGNRRKETIIEKMNELVEEWGVPEMIITDNVKEFVAIETKNWMTEAQIVHEKTNAELYKSNGRVERVIRTVREGIEKMGVNEMGKAIKEVEDKYNKT